MFTQTPKELPPVSAAVPAPVPAPVPDIYPESLPAREEHFYLPVQKATGERLADAYDELLSVHDIFFSTILRNLQVLWGGFINTVFGPGHFIPNLIFGLVTLGISTGAALWKWFAKPKDENLAILEQVAHAFPGAEGQDLVYATQALLLLHKIQQAKTIDEALDVARFTLEQMEVIRHFKEVEQEYSRQKDEVAAEHLQKAFAELQKIFVSAKLKGGLKQLEAIYNQGITDKTRPIQDFEIKLHCRNGKVHIDFSGMRMPVQAVQPTRKRSRFDNFIAPEKGFAKLLDDFNNRTAMGKWIFGFLTGLFVVFGASMVPLVPFYAVAIGVALPSIIALGFFIRKLRQAYLDKSSPEQRELAAQQQAEAVENKRRFHTRLFILAQAQALQATSINPEPFQVDFAQLEEPAKIHQAKAEEKPQTFAERAAALVKNAKLPASVRTILKGYQVERTRRGILGFAGKFMAIAFVASGIYDLGYLPKIGAAIFMALSSPVGIIAFAVLVVGMAVGAAYYHSKKTRHEQEDLLAEIEHKLPLLEALQRAEERNMQLRAAINTQLNQLQQMGHYLPQVKLPPAHRVEDAHFWQGKGDAPTSLGQRIKAWLSAPLANDATPMRIAVDKVGTGLYMPRLLLLGTIFTVLAITLPTFLIPVLVTCGLGFSAFTVWSHHKSKHNREVTQLVKDVDLRLGYLNQENAFLARQHAALMDHQPASMPKTSVEEENGNWRKHCGQTPARLLKAQHELDEHHAARVTKEDYDAENAEVAYNR